MDSTTGGRAVYTVANSRPSHLYLGAAEVRGQCDHLIEFAYMLLHFDSCGGEKKKSQFFPPLSVFLPCVRRLVFIRKPGSLLGYLSS